MLYSTLREQAETGDVLMIEGAGIISILIRALTGETLSHVGVLCWLDESKTCLVVVEMKEKIGWRLMRASDWIEDVMDDSGKVYFGKAPRVVSDNPELTRDYLFQRRKLKYDYFGLIKVWWSQIRKKGFRKGLQDRHAEVCSTFAAGAWENAEWNAPNKDLDPGDFFQFSRWTSNVVMDPIKAKTLELGEN